MDWVRIAEITTAVVLAEVIIRAGLVLARRAGLGIADRESGGALS